MIQHQIKLKLSRTQEEILESWLLCLSKVWNWAIRKIELDAQDGIFHKKQEFQNLLAGHGQRIDIPSHTLQGMLVNAYDAWQRCFKKIAKKPKLKGLRNKLFSIPLPDPIKYPIGYKVKIPGLGSVRYFKQNLPEGKIKCGRIVKRSSGWVLCLFIDAQPNEIAHTGSGKIGIDPGYTTTLTLSSGEKINQPKQLKKVAARLAQAQRGCDKKLVARLQERIKNRRKDANHKLSRKLVAENSFIAFSKDNIKGIAKSYGKSVAEACHYQLRKMIAYKCTTSGRQYIEVDSKGSTKTCSHCLAKTGPTGKAGLSVRQWECTECRTLHDRDHNSAVITLLVGLGMSLEKVV
jgi:transposase